MHIALAKAIAELCRRRLSEGDHPTEAPPDVEQLEFAVVALADEIERMQTALKEIDACYVDKFDGAIQGLKDNTPLDQPCKIARAAINDAPAKNSPN